jgi:alpha-tubulin suppressor-like RCC1 family protein
MKSENESTFVRAQPAVLSVAIAVVIALVLGSPGCKSSSQPPTGGQACSLNSDCTSPLVCALGKCRPECVTSADCNGGSCVDNGSYGVCQTPAELNTPCNMESDCPAPLACASDYRCRNLCTTAADCNVLGITGRLCAVDMQGVHYCADPSQVNASDMIVDQPPPDAATDAPVIEPLDATTHTMGGALNDVVSEPDVVPPILVPTSDASDGGDGEASVTCDQPCGPGYACANGACVKCGMTKGAPCCPSGCGADLTCISGTCTCGDPGEPCCGAGMTCNNNVTCTAGTCACGAAGQACCPTSGGDAAASACKSSLECAGTACSCLVACSGSTVRRSDGSLWNGTTSVTTSTDQLLIATSFSADSNGDGCAVDASGSLWCWGDNSYGQLGIGSTTQSSNTLPVQVVTSVGGAALANMKKVFFDPGDNSTGATACAADTSGNLWCWGNGANGQLGNGYTNNSTFAVPVSASSGGSQFTGVSSMAISSDHVCAIKTDGTLWCWGNNSDGQIGVNSSTQMQYLFPTQVQALFNTVVNVSVSANPVTGNITCATTNDGSVWCWGSNAAGVLGNGLTTGEAIMPVKVQASGDAGLPFAGTAQVELTSGSLSCALKAADRSIWCWGRAPYGGSLQPTPYVEASFPVSGVFVLCDNQGSGSIAVNFIDGNGTFHTGGSAAGQQVMCP